jgi:anti-sigma factor (TIGR02949 family)
MTEGGELNCEEVRELLSPYLDRELTSDEMTSIARHLEDCPDCMHKSTVFGQLSRVIKHWEGIKASEEARHKLMEQVRRASTRTQAKKTLPLLLLAILAGALVLGGAAALVVWFLAPPAQVDPEPDRDPVVECVHRANRVEVVVAGARVRVTGRRTIYAGQELRCNLGAAAQLNWPAAERPRAQLVLHGPASLKLVDERTLLLRSQGRLVFHLTPGGGGAPPPVIRADRWKVILPSGAAVGMVELTAEGALRVAMLSGSVRLGEGGPSVTAGKEIEIDAGGAMKGPSAIRDRKAFDLLVGGGPQ